MYAMIPILPGLLYLETAGRLATSERWFLGNPIRKWCGRMPYPFLEERQARANELMNTPEASVPTVGADTGALLSQLAD
jgi:hypothetical protein